MKRFFSIALFIAILIFCVAIGITYIQLHVAPSNLVNHLTTPTPPNNLTQPKLYVLPTILPKDNYAVFLVGDSMTSALGPHPYLLSKLLNQAYPNKNFIIDNYAEGGANILTLEKLLTTPRVLDGLSVDPAINRPFDILVIESHGHNPLSSFPLKEGLHLQEKTLDRLMTVLTSSHPEAIIIFLATLSPSPQFYGDGLINIAADQKPGWVSERQAYIENHLKYARTRQIPLIDLYSQHKYPDGTVNMDLINPDDNIHPSQIGVEWIQTAIANHILENNYLKH